MQCTEIKKIDCGDYLAGQRIHVCSNGAATTLSDYLAAGLAYDKDSDRMSLVGLLVG